MRIIQLLNCDNEPVGLYSTKRTDDLSVLQINFNDSFHTAEEICNDNNELDIHEKADELLESYGMYRIFSEEITTEVI